VIATHETLVLEAGAAAASLLTPGRVQRVLALGAGVRAEEIGGITPLTGGRVAVEIAIARAARLTTPRVVPVRETSGAALFTLRREDDVPDEESCVVALTWPADQPPPSPGALASALAAIGVGAVGAESLGAIFVGQGYARLEVPLGLALSGLLPEELTVDGRPLRLAIPGKKNS